MVVRLRVYIMRAPELLHQRHSSLLLQCLFVLERRLGKCVETRLGAALLLDSKVLGVVDTVLEKQIVDCVVFFRVDAEDDDGRVSDALVLFDALDVLSETLNRLCLR